MKTKTTKATVETPEVEISDVSVVTAEPVAEVHEAAVEASQPVVEMAVDSAPTAPETPESKRTVRGVALKPVRVVYAAGRGTVRLIVGGTKAVGAKSLKVVRRTPNAGPVEAPAGDIKTDGGDMVPEAPLHA